MDVLKPFLMLACCAFVAGFLGYLGLARIATSDAAPMAVAQEPWSSSTVSQPAPVDDFNPGKPI